jgi:hypothetical protein
LREFFYINIKEEFIMSEKEIRRRKIARAVMKNAWSTFKRCMLSWSTCLKVCWRTVRFLAPIHHSKARGTTFYNRQEALRRLSLYPVRDIKLALQRDLRNQFDTNAIAIIAEVKNKGEAVVGYVSKELAVELAPIIESGHKIITILDCITGIDRREGFLGLNFSYIII